MWLVYNTKNGRYKFYLQVDFNDNWENQYMPTQNPDEINAVYLYADEITENGVYYRTYIGVKGAYVDLFILPNQKGLVQEAKRQIRQNFDVDTFGSPVYLTKEL